MKKHLAALLILAAASVGAQSAVQATPTPSIPDAARETFVVSASTGADADAERVEQLFAACALLALIGACAVGAAASKRAG